MKTQKYNRKSFQVEAVRVTQENFEQVRAWCDGVQFPAAGKLGPFFKVDVKRPISDRQTRAYIGDWVLFAGHGFKVYSDRAFRDYFERVPGVIIENHPFPGEPAEMQEVVATPLQPMDAYISPRDIAAYYEAMQRSREMHPTNFPKPGPRKRELTVLPNQISDDYWAGHPVD